MYALLALGFALFAVMGAVGVATNGTIDDEIGDQRTGVIPSYLPHDIWTQGAQCPTCYAKPDPGQVFDHTWHDSTILTTETRYNELNITMNFTGTAVYAYCIMINANNDSWPLTTNLSFSIDGALVGSYYHASERTDQYTYNQLVYGNSSVPNGNHVFMIHLPKSLNNSAILFDYVKYTYDDATAPTSGSSSKQTSSPTVVPSNNNNSQTTKIVIAAVVAGTAGLALFLVILFFVFRRRLRRHHHRRRGLSRPIGDDDQLPIESPSMNSTNISPFMAHAPSHYQPFNPAYLYTTLPTSQSPPSTTTPTSGSYSGGGAGGAGYTDLPLDNNNNNRSHVASPPPPPPPLVTEQSQHQLLGQLRSHQQRLSSLWPSTTSASSEKGDVASTSGDAQSNRSAMATQSEVEELRQEIAKLRRMLTDSGNAPPEYVEL